jgi:hypothetical protein
VEGVGGGARGDTWCLTLQEHSLLVSECSNLWQIFGPDGDGMSRRHYMFACYVIFLSLSTFD